MTTNTLKEVDYIDGIKEFIEAEYITELLDRGSSVFKLTGNPIEDSIQFSGDVSLFNKQVYNKNDLDMTSSWCIIDNTIYISPNNPTSLYTYTYVTYKSKARTKKEGLYSIDYDKGILYLSTGLKKAKISYKRSIQYIEGQKMEQVERDEYNRNTIYNIQKNSDESLAYTYQLQPTQDETRTIEKTIDPRISLVTLGDKDD